MDWDAGSRKDAMNTVCELEPTASSSTALLSTVETSQPAAAASDSLATNIQNVSVVVDDNSDEQTNPPGSQGKVINDSRICLGEPAELKPKLEQQVKPPSLKAKSSLKPNHQSPPPIEVEILVKNNGMSATDDEEDEEEDDDDDDWEFRDCLDVPFLVRPLPLVPELADGQEVHLGVDVIDEYGNMDGAGDGGGVRMRSYRDTGGGGGVSSGDSMLVEEEHEGVPTDVLLFGNGLVAASPNGELHRHHPCGHPEEEEEEDALTNLEVWQVSWKATHFNYLPEWLQDNDYLHSGHRPPLPTFSACFRSVFRIHTETGNIWTHMLGCVAFIGMAGWFLTRSSDEVQLQEKIVFSVFFLGAILCLGFSSAFHTVHCHSPQVGKLFSKLDYCGISFMIVGSFVPWLYYCFYCETVSKWTYMGFVFVLGSCGVVVSMWDKFSEPQFRSLRAGVFIGLGLSGVIPCLHYLIKNGWNSAIYEAALGWLVLMAVLYITGALMYALRIPERFFPGKCDLWFQSHQIFHMFVIMAAFVHYHGITAIAVHRLTNGACLSELENI